MQRSVVNERKVHRRAARREHVDKRIQDLQPPAAVSHVRDGGETPSYRRHHGLPAKQVCIDSKASNLALCLYSASLPPMPLPKIKA